MKKLKIKHLVILTWLVVSVLVTSCGSQPKPDSVSSSPLATKTPEIVEPTIEPTANATQVAQSVDQLVSALLFDYENFLQANDIDSALNAIALALEIRPENIDILLIRATLYFETLQFDLALADTDTILVSDENNVEAHYLRGNVFFSQGDEMNAISEFNKVIELDPNFLNAYLQLGFLYVDIMDNKKAIEAFNTYIELADDDEDKSYMIDFVDTLKNIEATKEVKTTQESTNAE